VSEDAQDLVSRLLVKDPSKRLALKDIKYHKWIIRNTSAASSTLESGKENAGS